MKSIVMITALFTICSLVSSQTYQKPDSVIPVEKAKYLNQNLDMYLSKNAQYPQNAVMKEIQGDVVLSFIINKNGKLDSLAIVSSPDFSLSTSSMVTFSKIEDGWSPAKINNVTVDKKYLLVFRYRVYLNSQPDDYKRSAQKYFEKQKYKQALKQYNEAITDNKYDFELFEGRSKVKEMVGDLEGAKQDKLAAINLRDKVMVFVNVYAIGVTRVERRVEQRVEQRGFNNRSSH